MHLLGVSIDDNLNFNDHNTNITRKVGNQLQVLKRDKKLIQVSAKAILYKAYILPQLNYCSIVWHHCGKRNSDKLEKLNQRCLRFVYDNYHDSYDKLLQLIDQPSLLNRRYCDILILIYKALHSLAPPYISNLFQKRTSPYNLRGQLTLIVPRVNSTKYGLHSIRYSGAKLWNSLPDYIRNLPLHQFKSAIRSYNFSPECCSVCNTS